MISQPASNRFPMLIAVICTALMIVVGTLVWNGLGAETVTGLALIVAAVAISAISPAAGLAAVVMALPTLQELNPMPKGDFSLLELAILTSTIGIGINLLVVTSRSGWRHLSDLFVPAQVVIPVVMLLAATAISLLTLADHGHFSESLREVRTVILEPIMVLVTARLVLRQPLYRSWVSMVFMAVGAVIAGYGIVQILLDLGGVQAGDVTRATASYSHPNNLAVYLERTLLFTIGVAILRPRWIPVWLLAGVQTIGLVATFSRGALVGVMIGVAVVLVFIGARRWLLGLVAAGVVVGFIGLLLFPERLLDVGGDGNEPTRFAIWRSSIEMIKAHPVFGVGPDQFLYQYTRRFVEPVGWPERYTSHAHNIILDTWLRLGVPGLATLITLISGVIWWIQKNTPNIRQDAWAIGAVTALFGGFVHSMVDNGFFLADLATMSWFFIVLLITVPDRASPETSSVLTGPESAADSGRSIADAEWPTWQSQNP